MDSIRRRIRVDALAAAGLAVLAAIALALVVASISRAAAPPVTSWQTTAGTPLVPVASTGTVAYAPRVATDADGDMLVAWTEESAAGQCDPCYVEAAYASAGQQSGFSPAVEASPPLYNTSPPQPDVALAGSGPPDNPGTGTGDSIVAYEGAETFRGLELPYAVLGTDGDQFGSSAATPTALNGTGLSIAGVVMDQTGDALVAVQDSADVQVLAATAGAGTFTSAVDESNDPSVTPSLAIAPTGYAILAWGDGGMLETATTPQFQGTPSWPNFTNDPPLGAVDTNTAVNASIVGDGRYVVAFTSGGQPQLSFGGTTTMALAGAGTVAGPVVFDPGGPVLVLSSDGSGDQYTTECSYTSTSCSLSGTEVTTGPATPIAFTDGANQAPGSGRILYAYLDGTSVAQGGLDYASGLAQASVQPIGTSDGDPADASGSIDATSSASQAVVAYVDASGSLQVATGTAVTPTTTTTTTTTTTPTTTTPTTTTPTTTTTSRPPPPTETLTVIAQGTGTGTVASTDGEVNCSSNCAYAYRPGSLVTLQATAAPHSTFLGWTDACTGLESCSVAMNHAETAIATFEFNPPPGSGHPHVAELQTVGYRLKFRVLCLVGPCYGRILAYTLVPGERTFIRHGEPVTVPTEVQETVATGRYNFSYNAGALIVLKLDRAGRQLLDERGRMRVTLVVKRHSRRVYRQTVTMRAPPG